MCNSISFAAISSVKVIGTPIGSRPDPSKPIIDGDNDGKCQEEGGRWIPCPPGIGDGSVVDSVGRAIRKISSGDTDTKPKTLVGRIQQRREQAAQKAAKIREAAEKAVPQHKRDKIKKRSVNSLNNSLRNWQKEYEKRHPAPDKKDFADIGRFSRALNDWERAISSDFEKTELFNEIKDWTREMFSHEIVGRDGRKYGTVPRSPFVLFKKEPRIQVIGNIYNSSGDEVGGFSRTIGMDGRISHNYLDIESNMQKAGIGSAFNGATEILYRDAGVSAIETSGLSDSDHIGATHWAKNGFDWRNEGTKDVFVKVIEDAIDRYEQRPERYKWMFDSQDQVNDLIIMLEQVKKEALTDPDRITAADLLGWPGAEKWFQRADSNAAEGVMINYIRHL
jgi:hypothetical protein